MKLPVKKLHPDARLPTRGSEHAAGLDFYALNDVVIDIWETVKVHTGIAVAIPEGKAGFLWPRSGLAVKGSIDRLAGLIDADYRGEVIAILINHGDDRIKISAGDRIVQMVIGPVDMLNPVEVEELPETVRGENGFGSTGS